MRAIVHPTPGRDVVHLIDAPDCREFRFTHRDARTSESGAYVTLVEQDPKRWSLALIGEAERALGSAARLLRPGRFQFEAALQSAHLAPAFGHPADWRAIVALSPAVRGFLLARRAKLLA